MGIKFRCPNGHKIHVKSFLAGKKGICPDCGLSFRIPAEDFAAAAATAGELLKVEALPSKGEENQREAEPATAIAAGGGMFEQDFDFSSKTSAKATADGNVAVATSPVSAAPVAVAPIVTQPKLAAPTLPSPAMVAPVAIAPAPAAPTLDPIAQAPLAQWYVRPPAGGQYGPARGDVMRKWIDEGRVSADSLVWRDGLAEWRNAGELFPSLLKGTPAAGNGIALAVGAAALPGTAAATISLVPAGAVPGRAVPVSAVSPANSTAAAPPSAATASAVRSANRYVARKQSSATFGIVALFGLAFLSLILVVVLAIVLSRNYNQSGPKEKASPAAAPVPAAIPAAAQPQ